MYIPTNNRFDNDAEILDFVQKNSFGILTSADTEGGVFATHIPLYLVEKSGTYCLQGHIARANPHTEILQQNSQVLAIFQGAHAYISSSLYSFEEVSTWNYMAVHVYGTVSVLEGDALLTHLTSLTRKYEEGMETPRFAEDMNQEMLRRQLRGIFGFEIKIERWEGKAKLSQNRKDIDYQAIVQHLEKSNDSAERAIAKVMRQKRPL